MSAYADPVSTPGTPYSTFPSLATGTGGAGAGAGTGGGGGGGGGVGAGTGGGGAGAGGGGAGAGGGGGGGGGGGTWCVASQSASPTALQVALDYACGYGADCSPIQQGGSCFNPDTVHDHASYAFNSYYQKNPAPTSCDFGGTATITNTDPSKQTKLSKASILFATNHDAFLGELFRISLSSLKQFSSMLQVQGRASTHHQGKRSALMGIYIEAKN